MGHGSISYAQIADRYEHARGGDHRATQLAEALVPWLPDGLVCDVSAGTAVVTAHLRRHGTDLLACDRSYEMLTQAPPRLPRTASRRRRHRPCPE